MVAGDGGLGSAFVGEKIVVGKRNLVATKLLGEGGFSYVYLVKENTDATLGGSTHEAGKDDDGKKEPLVLKVTSIHSRSQRDIAEKEAKLLSRLSHPSIIKMYDTCYRQTGSASQGKGKTPKERPQHLILMEFCEGGHALDVCNKLASNNQRFDLPTLIIAFGQICNAVSYLHAQRPPIVHRDLKPVNFLVKNGAYKLCDFGSAVFGHVDLRTSKARAEAEEVIEKTTTQMFRAPEMVDLYMAKKLTQATDVWALGCCLYSLAYLQNCFEEGSNLAILSGKYTIPEENPYGEGLVKLLERMLTSDCKARADMTEVILCLSAVYSGRPLPERKRSSRASKTEGQEGGGADDADAEQNEDKTRVGTYRTDGQGIQQPVYDPTKATEGKKLASNSVAARRKRAAASVAPTAAPATAPAASASSSMDPLDFSSFGGEGKDDPDAFGNGVGFGEMKGFETKGGANETEFFGSFDKTATAGPDSNDGFAGGSFDAGAWGGGDPPPETTTTAANTEDAPDAEDPPEAAAAEGGGEKNDNSDAQKKDKSRRRRPGESSARSSSRRGPGVEAGVEAMHINEGGEAPKDRRSSRPSKPDDTDRRPTSRSGGNASRRKPRSSRGDRNDGPSEDLGGGAAEKEKKGPPPKGASFKKMFSRGKAPPPDP